ncbi:MAG: GspE/PulE family protein, partial [Candidatus Muiribacteriaceae bacterium]
AALRSFLRQDPDIIMVGEIRDYETAEIAIKASLTGHLVLSTLHTNDAPSTIGRLIDMGVEPYMVATSIILIQAQRLVRTICSHCKIEYKPKPELIKSLGVTPELLVRLGLKNIDLNNLTLYKGKGCEMCNNEGYRGRTGIFEVLPISEVIKEQVIQRKSVIEIRRKAREEGMYTLRESAIRKMLLGNITVEQVTQVTVE